MNHYFFALSLPNDAKEALRKLSDELQTHFPFKRWVHYQDFHITLAFLGHAKVNKLSDAIDYTKTALQNSQAFTLNLTTIGTFGNTRIPRILWVGTNVSKELHRTQHLVYKSCVNAGFELDKRPFTPHITIARKWSGEDTFIKEELLQYTAQIFSGFTMQAEEVVLYQTNPEQIPKYEKIESFKLLS